MALAMTQQPSRLDLESTDDRTLRAAGVIDCHTADHLLDMLRDMGSGGDITLDLSGVEFIDSSGIRSLVTSHQELETGNHRLVLRNTSTSVDRLLEITGLREHLHFG